MISIKHLLKKKSFRFTIAVATFLIITVASNLKIDTLNTNQFQTGENVSQVKAIAQIAPTETTPTETTPTETTPTDGTIKGLSSELLVLVSLGLVAIFATTILLTAFSPVLRSKSGDLRIKADFLNIVFPRAVEGVTVLLIVIVVTLLSVIEKIDPQGTISILSALVGYVLGKEKGLLENKEKKENGGNGGNGGNDGNGGNGGNDGNDGNGGNDGNEEE